MYPDVLKIKNYNRCETKIGKNAICLLFTNLQKSMPSDTFFECVYYFGQAGSNFEPVYIFEVI